jgi:hypothetical protein
VKGIEGIDYVITECSHCEGSGKCRCFDCCCNVVERLPDEKVNDVEYYAFKMNKELKKLQENVKCSTCKGAGKVVFWRE